MGKEFRFEKGCLYVPRKLPGSESMPNIRVSNALPYSEIPDWADHYQMLVDDTLGHLEPESGNTPIPSDASVSVHVFKRTPLKVPAWDRIIDAWEYKGIQ